MKKKQKESRRLRISGHREYLTLRESGRGEDGIDILIVGPDGEFAGGIIANFSSRGIWINHNAISSIIPREGEPKGSGAFLIANDTECGRFKVIHAEDC